MNKEKKEYISNIFLVGIIILALSVLINASVTQGQASECIQKNCKIDCSDDDCKNQYYAFSQCILANTTCHTWYTKTFNDTNTTEIQQDILKECLDICKPHQHVSKFRDQINCWKNCAGVQGTDIIDPDTTATASLPTAAASTTATDALKK